MLLQCSAGAGGCGTDSGLGGDQRRVTRRSSRGQAGGSLRHAGVRPAFWAPWGEATLQPRSPPASAAPEASSAPRRALGAELVLWGLRLRTCGCVCMRVRMHVYTRSLEKTNKTKSTMRNLEIRFYTTPNFLGFVVALAFL